MQGLRTLRASGKARAAAFGAAVCGGAALSVAGYQSVTREKRARAPRNNPAGSSLKVPAGVVDALAGALGEVAQILVLYPLDTIKVRCQSSGETALVVVQRLLRRGVNAALVQKLYAGALGAAACAVLVGAVHFASYECSRKAFLKLACRRRPAAGGAGAAGEGGDAAAAGAAAAGAGAGQGGAAAAEQDDGLARAAASWAAAVFAAVATAVVESPVELFRHNAQAGLVQPSFLREMARTVRAEGVGGLYGVTFVPHCLEALPHDVSELAMYGFMRDLGQSATRSAAAASSSSSSSSDGSASSDVRQQQQQLPLPHAWVAAVSPQLWDLITGAASGAAAVAVSMPFDTCKTWLQTHGADLTGRGLGGSTRLFFKTGRRILARKGVAGLYVGVTPRLMQQIPSAMVCWWTIAAFQRFMEPHTAPDDAEPPHGGHHHHHQQQHQHQQQQQQQHAPRHHA